MPRIDAFLQLGREQGCSDIHFTVGLPPLARLDGDLVPLKYRDLTLDETRLLVNEILDENQQRVFKERGAVDLSYDSEEVGRFRINVCRHMRGIAAICRVVPEDPPRLRDLGLPKVIHRFTRLSSGLVLVTGSSGTGKSTTLAAMIEEINRERNLNILTLEDPVEFVYRSQSSLVVQREVGSHVPSFRDGLRSALREDPDVILVGELRDLETITLAIEASETGHLIFGTLHARGAAQAVDRILDSFPVEAQAQVRTTLADNLKAVVSQELVRTSDGRGRRVVAEILVVTAPVAQLIRDNKTFQIPSAIATGRRSGMQLMDQALHDLVRLGEIDPDEAFLKAHDKKELIPFVTQMELLDLVGPPAPGVLMSRINSFLELVVRQGGSDLHVVAGLMPRIRIHGLLEPIRFRELTSEEITRILSEFMTEDQRGRLQEKQSVDFAYRVDGLGRFRVNVFQHLRGIAAVFRVIPTEIPSLDKAGLPAVVARTIATPRGLTLVTGPTGSGKSTTLAAMVDHINETRKAHIITVEDPVEFVHEFKSSVVTQREIGNDSVSFSAALRDSVREDPDVVLVGEMRDLETIQLALSAADTGVQVLGTLHTNGAVRSIDRLVGVFPAAGQEQIRSVLADSLRMIVSQQLVRKADGTGRVVVPEVLINNQAAASMIRVGRSHQLASVIQSGARVGMCSLDSGLQELLRKQIITGEEAHERAIDKQRFERYLLEEVTA